MKGLTSTQAAQLLSQYGQNVISEQKKKNIILKFLEQFNNFLIYLLIFAAGLSFYLGDRLDGYLILAIVLLNGFFGLYQEYKAEEALKLLKKMTITKVRVIRDGKEKDIDSRQLVPQDVIYVEEGSRIPADAVVLHTKHLEINEASLTGESLPVAKDFESEVFMGTVVTKGRGYLKIIKTAMFTQFGKIARGLEELGQLETPLQKKLKQLSKNIGIIGITVSLVVFSLSLIQGSQVYLSFLLAVSLMVAVVPEGLPAVMAITLAIGVREMAKRKAIIRKLSAIEALGSITLIATDKTGTLTSNEMRVREIFLDNKIYKQTKLPQGSPSFKKLILNSVLCSTASLVEPPEGGRIDILGDPTEGALLLLAKDAKVDYLKTRQSWNLKEEKPFDSQTKRMSVLVSKNGESYVFTKGAPESILSICQLTDEDKKRYESMLDEWAKEGLRVLALSFKKTEKLEIKNHNLLGMVAIYDPPRIEVEEALQKTKKAGIKVVMITGDNEKTAEAIGVSVGLIKKGDEIILGEMLDNYSDEELLKILPKIKVFARINPLHKRRIVCLYQKMGEIVAVTGDGVNDAVALKQADVGVAMGLVGTDVARETADMIITDDNFATIVNAVEEGRNIVKNLKHSVTYLLTGNFSEALSLTGGLLLGITNLFYPIQILYINLISDGLPALALAFSPRDPNVMRQSPKKSLEILEGFDKKFIVFVGISAATVVLISYFLFAQTGRTAAFSVLAIIQSFILVAMWLSHHTIHKNLSKLKSLVFILAFLIPFIGQLLIVKIGFLTQTFKAESISYLDFAYLTLFSSLILISTRLARTLFNGHRR